LYIDLVATLIILVTSNGGNDMFKICRCCGTKATLRARKCKPCGGRAIWDTPTAEQLLEEQKRKQRMLEVAAKLLTQ
jgi:hypothetical protein